MSSDSLHTRHERLFQGNRFVYPVLSRRAGGLSIGVNLNPDKICNFHCVYCQVERADQSETRFVETERLLEELGQTLDLTVSGRIYGTEKFRDVPQHLRRVNDIAFSGDGEPTTHKNFDDVIAACAEVKRRIAPADVKMVLITNASMFHRPHVRRGLEKLDDNNGEIWAKLEAGTEAYFKLIDRTPISYQRILDNITEAASVRPLVIQSLFMRVHGQPPSPDELEAYCGRLNDITTAGGQLSLVQVYTVARSPAENFVTPLADGEVEAIAELIRRKTGLSAVAY
ncbi:MAG: radical SAM protein [Pirellulaceae bacterium]|nr:radical SAM protein [Pirellulaceae bacterium]